MRPNLAMNQRQHVEAEIERLIAFLDALDGDCDLEDGGDAEPSLPCYPRMINGRPEYDLEEDPAEDGIADQDALELIQVTDTRMRGAF